MQDFRNKKDEYIAAAAQAGDVGAETELLNRYKSTVRGVARKYFLAGGETEDLVQEGMIGLVFAIRNFRADGGTAFKNFAYLCVRRRICSALRAADGGRIDPDILPDSLAGAGTPEDTLLAEEDLAELRIRLMKALSDFEFRVTLLWLYGESYREIAETTNKPLKSVDNALARARKKLQAALTDGKK